MTDRKFVDAIFSELFENNFVQYKNSLTKPVNGETDPYARARSSLALLSDDQKMDVVNFLRVVIADTASVLLGTLDGVHFPDNFEGEIQVTFNGEEIQGDLQDMFIERAQEDGVYN
ncbi:hypothetical protein [Pseudomonas sp. PSKL.D1]|uniref:hypothetical protein n=1 Tax=Pseudomonas sp. PSKL.D1 TaxID=3029060 RepID=UPI0023818181|nr:hypothetical protein [Pseudomonas sp. PSKL.D1]WDY60296.1 hypothetical protein PVV54_11935 [Pseudomonas sp. PSKL.D1]